MKTFATNIHVRRFLVALLVTLVSVATLLGIFRMSGGGMENVGYMDIIVYTAKDIEVTSVDFAHHKLEENTYAIVDGKTIITYKDGTKLFGNMYDQFVTLGQGDWLLGSQTTLVMDIVRSKSVREAGEESAMALYVTPDQIHKITDWSFELPNAYLLWPLLPSLIMFPAMLYATRGKAREIGIGILGLAPLGVLIVEAMGSTNLVAHIRIIPISVTILALLYILLAATIKKPHSLFGAWVIVLAFIQVPLFVDTIPGWGHSQFACTGSMRPYVDCGDIALEHREVVEVGDYIADNMIYHTVVGEVDSSGLFIRYGENNNGIDPIEWSTLSKGDSAHVTKFVIPGLGFLYQKVSAMMFANLTMVTFLASLGYAAVFIKKRYEIRISNRAEVAKI